VDVPSGPVMSNSPKIAGHSPFVKRFLINGNGSYGDAATSSRGSLREKSGQLIAPITAERDCF
jgi:hypothetical protein